MFTAFYRWMVMGQTAFCLVVLGLPSLNEAMNFSTVQLGLRNLVGDRIITNS